MRIITRPDFDGVVCAVLLKEVLGGATPVRWVQPNEMQSGQADVGPHDVIANLPLSGDCALWFDHHVTNAVERPFKGLFRIAPSAAGLVYEYFRDKIDVRFQELIRQADKIDAARLSLDEILHPEHYPYILLSMTVFIRQASDMLFCDHLVELLRSLSIKKVLSDPTVHQRCEQILAANKTYKASLQRCTTLQGIVSITDFRSLTPVPDGNRFLVYSLFPQAVVNVKLYDEDGRTVVKVGHSILNRACNVNVGKLLARYGGGGHRGAGACRLPSEMSAMALSEILRILSANQSNE